MPGKKEEQRDMLRRHILIQVNSSATLLYSIAREYALRTHRIDMKSARGTLYPLLPNRHIRKDLEKKRITNLCTADFLVTYKGNLLLSRSRLLHGNFKFIVNARDEMLAMAMGVGPTIKHSTLALGVPVRFAGTIVCENGIIKRLTNDSGHYQGDYENFRRMLDYFKNLGIIDSANTEIEVVYIDHSGETMKQHFDSAEDFYKSNSDLESTLPSPTKEESTAFPDSYLHI